MNRRTLLRGALIVSAFLFVSGCIYFRKDPFSYIGAAFCHQFGSRTPAVENHAYPLCYRCTGTFMGLFFGLMFIRIFGEKPKVLAPYALGFAAAALLYFGIDILNSTTFLDIDLYPDRMISRMLSGYFVGQAIVLVIWPIREMVLEREEEESFRPMFHLLGCGTGAAILSLLVFRGGMIGYAVIAPLSTLTVAYFLSQLYRVIAELIFKRDAVEISWIVTLLQITLLGAFHYVVIGAAGALL